MTGKAKGCVHYGLWLYNNVNSNLLQQLIHICSAETELTNTSAGCLYAQIHSTWLLHCGKQLAHRPVCLLSALSHRSQNQLTSSTFKEKKKKKKWKKKEKPCWPLDFMLRIHCLYLSHTARVCKRLVDRPKGYNHKLNLACVFIMIYYFCHILRGQVKHEQWKIYKYKKCYTTTFFRYPGRLYLQMKCF